MVSFNSLSAMNLENYFKSYLEWDKEAIYLEKNLFRKFSCELKRIMIWRIDLALRYSPIINIIKENDKWENILEVGSGSIGITSSLRQKVTGLDKDFQGPKLGYLNGIKGTAENIPFDNETFDFVISVDMLEHLPFYERKRAIAEMIRVSRKFVIISAPCGDEAEKYDRKLNDYYRNKFGKNHKWLIEHIKFGLPKAEDILDIFKDILNEKNLNYKINMIDNVNLKIWYFYNKFLSSHSDTSMILKNKVLFPFYPLFKRFNKGNCYRKLFIVFKS